MTILEAFNLSQKQWDEIESQYEALQGSTPEEMIVSLLGEIGSMKKPDIRAKKMLALGIMIGRASR